MVASGKWIGVRKAKRRCPEQGIGVTVERTAGGRCAFGLGVLLAAWIVIEQLFNDRASRGNDNGFDDRADQ